MAHPNIAAAPIPPLIPTKSISGLACGSPPSLLPNSAFSSSTDHLPCSQSSRPPSLTLLPSSPLSLSLSFSPPFSSSFSLFDPTSPTSPISPYSPSFPPRSSSLPPTASPSPALLQGLELGRTIDSPTTALFRQATTKTTTPTSTDPNAHSIPILTPAPVIPSTVDRTTFPIASRHSALASSVSTTAPRTVETLLPGRSAPSAADLTASAAVPPTPEAIIPHLLSKSRSNHFPEFNGNMARRQSCSDLPPTSILIPPSSRSSSPPFVSKVISHSKSVSTDMRSTVKNRLLRNWIGHSGQQEYKALERSLARFQKDRNRIDVLKSNLLPWLQKDQACLDTLSEASLRTGRQLILQW
ncbi:hypothetical protein B0O80DRAFT_88922 [Mortierella sp. GBAus27b]|nr:hypothetical protein B0O80DRAFT_88922 [Mortierella sp. GBAus27b]